MYRRAIPPTVQRQISDCLSSNWTAEEGEEGEGVCPLLRLLQALVLTQRRMELSLRPAVVCAGYTASLVTPGGEGPSLGGFERYARSHLRAGGKVRIHTWAPIFGQRGGKMPQKLLYPQKWV